MGPCRRVTLPLESRAMAKHRILIADELSPRALDVFGGPSDLEVEVKTGLKPAELKSGLAGVHGLAVRSATKVTAELIEGARELEVVGRAGIGVDNIDVAAASRRGIIVMNTPSGNAVTPAEHALFLLCALGPPIPQARASRKGGRWEKDR